jgi:hypothetical protein
MQVWFLFLVPTSYAFLGLSLAFPFCLPYDGSNHRSFIEFLWFFSCKFLTRKMIHWQLALHKFFITMGVHWCFCANSFKTWQWRGVHFLFSILFLFSFYVLHFQVWNDVGNDFYVECARWTSICTILHNQRCF